MPPAPPLPAAVVRRSGVAETQRLQDVSSKPIHRYRIRQISAIKREHRAFRGNGDKHARDYRATAQTTNRCCICRRNRRNRYFDPSQARNIAPGTEACGTSALARKQATAGHRLKANNFVSVK